MRGSLAALYRKRLTIPQLSPTHTSARITQLLKPAEAAAAASYPSVEAYDPVFVLQCSSDLIADRAFRDYDDQMPSMIVETCDDGLLKWEPHIVAEFERNGATDWLDVGTVVGVIDDEDDHEQGDDEEEDWLWQGEVSFLVNMN